MSQDDDFEILLELTAQLQLQDIEEWRAAQKGKGRVGGRPSDTELAFNALETEFKSTLQGLTDRRIAKSAQRAATGDQDLIDIIAQIEAQEQADHEYALLLSANPNAQPPAPNRVNNIRSQHLGVGLSGYRRPDSPSASSVSSQPWSVADSFASLAVSQSTRASTLSPVRQSVNCVICNDRTTQAYQAPCGCFYDRECLTELFQRATVDESLFPPRCCTQQISFQVVRAIFSPQLVRAFEQKAEEFGTTNRLYCHSPACSAFLGPAVANERLKTNKQCTSCYRATCSFCKSPGHASYVPCPTDAGAQQVLALGREEGWQSCPSCHHMVELDTGCYHMTCRCRHEFCYICAEQWKNCTCPQWDEDRLVTQAERRVVREQGVLPRAAQPVQIAVRQAEVRRVADDLRENHECAHHRFGFARQGGSGNCESCGNWLRDFLLRCRGCSIQVCVRCRRNRL
ncbi:hypothetical protein BDV93DRAFT_441617 [Ceratobasidium sp. AG-I]|nr:hypothetical protein BDV93DRAFT_441617 [Ceratobasidium sp. AG-I]